MRWRVPGPHPARNDWCGLHASGRWQTDRRDSVGRVSGRGHFVYRAGPARLFFPRRRRHARYWRDWSSAVCSSDLEGLARRHLQLPKAGAAVTAGKPFGEIESVKAVFDLYAPVSGTITEVNSKLAADPSAINLEIGRASCRERV